MTRTPIRVTALPWAPVRATRAMAPVQVQVQVTVQARVKAQVTVQARTKMQVTA
ncbi:hypothetical protein [Winogradskya humida]|uniref:Uncharacterized protein n=1 Tax=Winogradskya humida TaxID=113566 RepID=A0ABQ3ZK10_9ACTN|nr:hypothetical protein [Actinoplanes humidus]GIE18924.1 hypothetical protein Ahu01nite_020260 [Actinoplanes humidus]